MHSFNLYRYYDKSLAEIHRLRKEAMSAQAAKMKEKGGGGKKLLTVLSYSFGGIVGIGILLTLLFTYVVPFDTVRPYIPFLPEKEMVASPVEELIDNRSEEEKQGFVKIQVFEFAEEGEPVTLLETASAQPTPPPPAPVVKKPAPQPPVKKAEPKPVPAKTAKPEKAETEETVAIDVKKVATEKVEPKKAPSAKKLYSVMVEDVTEDQYARLQQMQNEFHKSVKIEKERIDEKMLWNVYRVDREGKENIAGQQVIFEKRFATKHEAVAFAKELGVKVVINAETIKTRYMTVKTASMELEEAKKFASATKIRDKIIKIVRQKQ